MDHNECHWRSIYLPADVVLRTLVVDEVAGPLELELACFDPRRYGMIGSSNPCFASSSTFSTMILLEAQLWLEENVNANGCYVSFHKFYGTGKFLSNTLIWQPPPPFTTRSQAFAFARTKWYTPSLSERYLSFFFHEILCSTAKTFHSQLNQA